MVMKRYAIAIMGACVIFFTSDAASGAAGADVCMDCHTYLTPLNDRAASLTVDLATYEASIHGEAGIECVDCHYQLSGVEDFSHEAPREAPLERVDCSMCHESESEDYELSVHGEAYLAGDESAPRCSSCHGTHDIKPTDDIESSVYPLNVADVCMKCHTDPDVVAEHDLPSPEKIREYEDSVHMKALKDKGLIVSATCNDCHGSHKIRPSDDPSSLTNRLNLPETCAKCHQGIYATYRESVHGRDNAQGNEDVPVCTDCHGDHSIKAATDPESTVYATNVAETCSNCHEDETLSERYRFPSLRLRSYLGTYHGIASSLGDTTVANCASCHGHHDIRPSDDPKSAVHPDNIPRTCSKCHPQAGRNFALGKVHVTEVRESNIGAYVAEKMYAVFIGGSVGGFFLFIMTDMVALGRKMRNKPGTGRKLFRRQRRKSK